MTEAAAPPPAGVDVLTFGCRLNLVESERMRHAAEAAGLRHLTIVNTCAVTGEAVRQGRQAIRRLARERPGATIAVTGCAAAIDPAAFRAMPGVGPLIANAVKTDAATWAALAASSGDSPALTAPVKNPSALAADAAQEPGLPDLPPASHTRGFVEIQNGCDHRCTFCVIPFGRGASRSTPVETIEARVRALVAAGARDVVLTGVDITAYGADLPERPTLGTLVRHLLAAVPSLDRLRLSSIDCIEADPALLEAIATEPRLMPHLHLSLQSGSDLVLKRMKRRHGRADAVAFCAALRAARPGIVLGADIITGFPTETEAAFADSLSLVEDCGLTHLHVFPYSPRPGTPATRMPQVPREIARERAGRLRGAGATALTRHLDAQVGRRLAVLMEQGGKGRAPDFTAVRSTTPRAAGTLIEIAITGHADGTLTGRAVEGSPQP